MIMHRSKEGTKQMKNNKIKGVRVNIEPDFWVRSRKEQLAAMMGWHTNRAIGALVRLWFVSQNLGRESGSIQDICDWAYEWDESNKFIHALLASGFLKKIHSPDDPNAEYLIIGNQTQIKSVERYFQKKSQAGIKGNELRWKTGPEKRKSSHPIANNNYNNKQDNNCYLDKYIYNKNICIDADKTPQINKNIKISLNQAIQTWLGTLKHFGIDRGIAPNEDIFLLRKIEKCGLEEVELALLGARYEPKTPTFDPKSFVSLKRIFGNEKDMFQKNVNRGHQAKSGKLTSLSSTSSDILAKVKSELEQEGKL